MHREMDDIRLIEYLREDEMSKYYKKYIHQTLLMEKLGRKKNGIY